MLFSYAHAKHPELVEKSIKWPFIGMALWLPIVILGFVMKGMLPHSVIVIGSAVLCIVVFMACFHQCVKMIDRAYED